MRKKSRSPTRQNLNEAGILRRCRPCCSQHRPLDRQPRRSRSPSETPCPLAGGGGIEHGQRRSRFRQLRIISIKSIRLLRTRELTETACNEVNGVVVREVHGRPPQPHGVEDVYREKLGKQVTHEESLEGRPSRVQGGESTEDDRGGVKSRGVQIDTEELINGLETRSISRNGVVGRSQPVGVFIPWWRAWEDCLNEDSRDVHVSECTRPGWQSARGAPNKHAGTDDDGRHIVNDSVW
jgi:hypothetical protein